MDDRLHLQRLWRTVAPVPAAQHLFRVGAELRQRLWRPLLPRLVAQWYALPVMVDELALQRLHEVLAVSPRPTWPGLERGRVALAGHDAGLLVDMASAVAQLSPLAAYEAHYLQWLEAGLADPQAQDEAIVAWRNWRRQAREGLAAPAWRKAWEPYPRARRVLACLRAAARLQPQDPLRQALLQDARAAAAGLAWLVERHLDGNHLLVDRLAQAAAAIVFGGDRAAITRAELELARQFQQDGAHVEASPMYHAVCLEDALTVRALLDGRDGAPWDGPIQRALCWLAAVRHPDGALPGFGDSDAAVLAQLTLTPMALRAAVGRQLPDPLLSSWVAGNLGDLVVVHTAQPVWAAQPGHAHDDTLSLEVSLGGVRWICDAGLGGYEGDPDRSLCRSAASHSTVAVTDRPALELWSAFRVGARGSVTCVRVGQHRDWQWVFAEHRWPQGDIVHRRLVGYRTGVVLIADALVGAAGQGRLLLGPGVQVADETLQSGDQHVGFAATVPFSVGMGARFAGRRRQADGPELRYAVGETPVWLAVGAGMSSPLTVSDAWQAVWRAVASGDELPVAGLQT